LIYSRWFTHISGHPSATGRAQDSESTPAKDRRSTAGPLNHPYSPQYFTTAPAGEVTSHAVVGTSVMSGCDWRVLQMRQELEKIRRRLESELAEAREQLAEKTSQLDELQAMMNRREEELQQALNKSARPLRSFCLIKNYMCYCIRISF